MPPEINELFDICRQLGPRADYFQGGGGNISVKVDEMMYIKASGRRIDSVTSEGGLAKVLHSPIKEFYEGLDQKVDTTELITMNSEIVLKNTINGLGGTAVTKPSMEVGFHSLLGKFVIHSHSVYANILNCTEDGDEVLRKMFPGIVIIPYELPGAPLTVALSQKVNAGSTASIFLTNHGLIVSAENGSAAHQLHEAINAKLRQQLDITTPYPKVKVRKGRDGIYESGSVYLFNLESELRETSIDDNLLFPDQAVYMNKVTYNNKVQGDINFCNGKIRYSDNLTDALAREETLIAWVYITRQAKRLGLRLRPLSTADKYAISGLESEKYRKNVH